MSRTNFVRTHCIGAHFDHANLSESIFWHVNAKGAFFNNADLTNVNFTLTNLHSSDFTNTRITDSQLWNAISIQDARLPNGTLLRDPNLINNGQADCNISLLDNWKLLIGKVSTMMSDEDRSNCHFALQSFDIGAIMLQRINLSNISNFTFWSHSQAILKARMGIGVSIQLRGMNSTENILVQQNFSKFNYISNHFRASFIYRHD
jgi:uncharacterized protein YjbI with pentapeptide repeats